MERKPSENNDSHKFSRRKFNATLVGSTIGGGILGSTPVAAKRKEREGPKVLKVYQTWLANHGDVVNIETQGDTDDSFVQILTFENGNTKKIHFERSGQSALFVKIDGKTYKTVVESQSKVHRSSAPDTVAFGGNSPTRVKESQSNQNVSIQSTSYNSADDAELTRYSGGTGRAYDDYDLSTFRGETAFSGAGAYYGAQAIDVYVDVFANSSVSEIRADFDYDYSFTHGTFLGTSEILGQFIIRDMQNGNTNKVQICSDKATGGGAGVGEETGSKSALLTTSSGSGTYRLGIRAYTEVDAYSTAWSTASLYSFVGEIPRYLKLNDLAITNRY